MENNINLKKRFVSDFKLPIQILHEPYFSQRIELFEKPFQSKTKWDNLKTLINNKFDSNSDLFLTKYHETRDVIMMSTVNNKSYQEFINDKDFDTKFKINTTYPNKNLYTCEQVGENDLFISIDLVKANFQALKFYNKEIVFNAETYKDYINKFTDLDYIINSKYTRQVIFGKMNPKRTIKIETYIINKILELDNVKYLLEHFDIFSINVDEIILKVKNSHQQVFFDLSYDFLNKNIVQKIKDCLGVDVVCEKFKLKLHQFEGFYSKNIINVFEKDNFTNTANVLKNLPNIYYNQVYKLLNNIDLTQDDLVFYYEHEISRFLKPITKK